MAYAFGEIVGNKIKCKASSAREVLRAAPADKPIFVRVSAGVNSMPVRGKFGWFRSTIMLAGEYVSIGGSVYMGVHREWVVQAAATCPRVIWVPLVRGKD